ncbi:MAG TPA: DUF4012 domain-containing protein [Anaerolineae bacterium]|nr:DUF4012 domain-containing protein [Anaerolineae bacterium]HQK12567.1 DUF4012 domain-containing protein [Anaerolineae bacterium]
MSVIDRNKRKIALGLVIAGLLLIVFWVGQTGYAAVSLARSLKTAQTLLDGDPMAADVSTLGKLLRQTRRDVVTLRRNVGWLAGIGPAFRRLPKVGPLLGDAPALLTLADGLTEAGALLWDAAEPALTASNTGGSMLEKAPEVFSRLSPNLPRARAAVARALEAYATLDVAALPGRVQGPLTKIGPLLPLLDDGLTLAGMGPTLLGLDAPRTYLVLAINDGELRAGGGFISGVGEIHLESGKVAGMTFMDSYAVDDFKQPYPLAPEALRQFMGIDLLVFRDSNWSPDFPTAARQALALYRPAHPVTVDGIVTVDMQAAQRLIDAFGPLKLPDTDEPVTGATLLEYLYSAWAPEDGNLTGEWWKQRKAFMGTLAEAIMGRVAGGDVNWLALLKVGRQLIAEKHVMMYFVDANVQTLLASRGWDAGLRVPQGDYAMVVEANVGYNKASAKLDRTFAYAVDLTQSPPRATMTLAYTHTSQVDIACVPEARYDPEYTQMMDRCYWGYLRLYVPQGAQLLQASRHPIPAEAVANKQAWEGNARVTVAPEGPYTVFEQALLLPTASRATVYFTYTLPDKVVRRNADGTFTYHLLWQKQAGLVGVPARVVLRLPQNAVLCPSQPHLRVGDAGTVFVDMALHIDQELSICYTIGR